MTHELTGQRVIVTRSAQQAGELVHLLERRGAEVLAVPVIRILPPEDWDRVDRVLARLDAYAWVVFASTNAVEFFLGRRDVIHPGEDWPSRTRVAAVGTATAALLSQRGVPIDLVPEEFTGDSLLESMRETGPLSGRSILLPQSSKARTTLADGLTGAGARVDCITVYRNLPIQAAPAAIQRTVRNGDVDWVVFTSPSTVQGFVSLFGTKGTELWRSNAKFASIGPTTSRALQDEGLAPAVEPAEHTLLALVDAMAAYVISSDT